MSRIDRIITAFVLGTLVSGILLLIVLIVMANLWILEVELPRFLVSPKVSVPGFTLMWLGVLVRTYKGLGR